MQLHLQVSPADFAAAWNAAQALAGPQLALGANSPFLFGKRLWAETRTELFLQATDTRSVELRNQGVRPPVFFGERWITSIFDLFEENVRYFPALLPETTDEDPEEVLAAGKAPRLQELRLHNGTVYRWNRPVYDVVDGLPHLRVENRVLPAGPTVVDVLANAAFYYGVVKVLAEEDRPVWTKMSLRRGQAQLRREAPGAASTPASTGPGSARSPGDELLLRHLLPLAHEGLQRWGVSGAAVGSLPGHHRGPLQARRNGAWWQIGAVHGVRGARGRPAYGVAADARALLRGHERQRPGSRVGVALTAADGLGSGRRGRPRRPSGRGGPAGPRGDGRGCGARLVRRTDRSMRLRTGGPSCAERWPPVAERSARRTTGTSWSVWASGAATRSGPQRQNADLEKLLVSRTRRGEGLGARCSSRTC